MTKVKSIKEKKKIKKRKEIDWDAANAFIKTFVGCDSTEASDSVHEAKPKTSRN